MSGTSSSSFTPDDADDEEVAKPSKLVIGKFLVIYPLMDLAQSADNREVVEDGTLIEYYYSMGLHLANSSSYHCLADDCNQTRNVNLTVINPVVQRRFA